MHLRGLQCAAPSYVAHQVAWRHQAHARHCAVCRGERVAGTHGPGREAAAMATNEQQPGMELHLAAAAQTLALSRSSAVAPSSPTRYSMLRRISVVMTCVDRQARQGRQRTGGAKCTAQHLADVPCSCSPACHTSNSRGLTTTGASMLSEASPVCRPAPSCLQQQ